MPATRVSRWQRYARIIGFVILAIVSIHGIREFMAGDAATVTEVWSGKLVILPLVLVFAILDVCLETAGWMWIFERLGLRARDLTGAAACIAGKAGLLLPAQLGRLIRPDLMVRLGRGTMAQNLQAEAAVFVLDSISVVALFAGLVAFRVHPALGPLASAVVISVSLFIGNRLVRILSGTKFEFPSSFWWSWQAFAIVLVEAAGWISHGIAFYFVASDLPGNVGLWDGLFFAPGSALLGLSSGLPGGIGATEALLGASLGFNGVPQAHLAVSVAAFRVITFWLWLPVGWLALMWGGRQARKRIARLEASRAAEAEAKLSAEITAP